MTGLVAAFLAAAVLLLCAPGLASAVLHEPTLTSSLAYGALALLFSVLATTQAGVLNGLEAFHYAAKSRAFTGIAALCFTALGCYIWGLTGAVWALGGAAAVAFITSQRFLNRSCKAHALSTNFRDCLAEKRILWTFSLPALLCSIAVAPVHWAVMAVLSRRAHGIEQVALFNAANQWRMAILFLPLILSQTALPFMANLKGGGNQTAARNLNRINIFLSFGISTLSVLPVLALSRLAMLSYGPGFGAGRVVLCLLALSTIPTPSLTSSAP